jgi:dsDNA-specific endonuclease/ATPase MutS2
MKMRGRALSGSLPTLDLHGKKTDEVFDLMDAFLRREERKGASGVRILHGIGTGKVKEKALEYCRLSGHEPKPDRDQAGRQNPGAFLLYL